MDEWKDSLEKSLVRMSDALAKPPDPPSSTQAGRSGSEGLTAALVLAGALFIAGFATGHALLIVVALLIAAGAGALHWIPQSSQLLVALQGGPLSSTSARIGMGATVARDAIIEPGASVEMGATVHRGAVVRSGAVVRMGAVVSRGATVEKGAIVSWGAVVGRDAVVGENAVVGAGATVRRDSRVPAGMRIGPGSIHAARDAGPPVAASRAAATAPADPRDQRLAAVCGKLEAELKASPDHVRTFLGGSAETIATLRRTCEDLSRRELAMREEADPQAVARLQEDRAALAKRLSEERDPQLRTSLEGAAAAVDELVRQRELLRLGADRLQAEHTRLLYTLEGIASQFVRLRTAGAGAAPELEQSLAQLRDGIDAIANALEEVSRDAPAAMRDLATSPADAGFEAAARGTRTRE